MLKKISAALLVASVFTAPALAENAVKTDQAPVTKSVTAPAKPVTAPAKSADAMKPAETVKPSVANAKAQATDTQTVKKATPRRSHRLHVSHRVTKKHIAHRKTTSSKKVSAIKPAAKQIKNKV